MSFKYYNNPNSELTDLSKIQNILKEENIVLDSKYLPVLEQAENGNYTAIAEMAGLFTDGEDGIKPNYNLGKRYMQKALEQVKKSNNPASVLEVLANLAILESNFNYEDQAREVLREAIELTLQEFPLSRTIGNITSLLHFIAEDEQESE